MQRAQAKADASSTLHAARGSQTAAFANPTPQRMPFNEPSGHIPGAAMPAAGNRHCACGGGCPNCQGGNMSQPVPSPLRARAESVLGVGLSDVRLAQSGPLASHVAQRGADAGTQGNVIAFPRGLPDVSQSSGRFALGHELAHVAQQRNTNGKGNETAAMAVQEHSADQAARSISGGGGKGARTGDLPAENHAGAPVQFGVFEAIGGIARQANDFVAPVVDPVMQLAEGAVAEIFLGMADIPAHAISFITNLPQRLLRLLADAVQNAVGVPDWLAGFVDLFLNWQSWTAVWDHMVRGILDGAAWVGEFFIHALELVGVGEFLQFLWARANIMVPLNSAQIGAAQEVHPPGLIPYSLVRIDHNSLVARLAYLFSPGFSGSAFDQIFGTAGAGHRSVTTMHIIHTGHVMDEPLAVHELTHVAQYELVGAMYMPQAIHAQQFGQQYDYANLDGGLGASITAGRTYASFNREQQAMICEDYYQQRHGVAARYGGSGPDLEYFINDYWGRAGIPFLRWFVDQ